MKMAKASEADMAMAIELANALESLAGNWGAHMPEKIARPAGDDEAERFDIDNHDDCRRVLRYLIGLVRSSSLFRVVFGMAVLLDPVNRIVDPDAGTLEHHPDVAKALQRSGTLTFAEFRAANRTRCLKWHPAGIESWSDSDWITAIVGELGELAGLIKMRNRERDGLPGNKFSPTNEQIAKEAADVYTYLDLFCERNGIDLGLSAALKFNEVSERVGFPDRIHISEG